MIFESELEGSAIFAGEESLTLLSSWLYENHPGERLFVLADSNTSKFCLPIITSVLGERYTIHLLEIGSGEKYKNIHVCIEVWEKMLEYRLEKNDIILNLGGGVVSDLGGFVASTFKRGIGFVNIPTTLMGMTDAAIGGKNGVDFKEYKNQIGTINFPVATFIWPGFLNTLSEREIKNGLAEIYKHGLIADAKLWNLLPLSINSATTITALLPQSLNAKIAIVRDDPMENGRRKSLNFGHTIGHAIESWFLNNTDYSLLHGEAIAAGMIMELWLSVKFAGLDPLIATNSVDKIKKTFGVIPLLFPDHVELVHLMMQDKKNRNQTLRFSLIESVGTAVWNVEVPAKDVIDVFSQYQSLQHK